MKLLNTNRFGLAGTNDRWVHLATVQNGLHEYICIYDTQNSRCYIEEIIGTQLCVIEDNDLMEELTSFLFEKNITNLAYGLPVAD